MLLFLNQMILLVTSNDKNVPHNFPLVEFIYHLVLGKLQLNGSLGLVGLSRAQFQGYLLASERAAATL